MSSRVIPDVTADENAVPRQHNSSGHPHASSILVVPPSTIGIPTAAYKRRMKTSDKPGIPTGTLISARLVFNRLYREQMSGEVVSSEDYPVYPEMANSVKDLIRSFLYQRMGLRRGERTFTSVKIEYADLLSQLKRKMEDKFPVLQAAQNSWIATKFIKEAMQRDKKAKKEAAKKSVRRNSAARGCASKDSAFPSGNHPSVHHHPSETNGVRNAAESSRIPREVPENHSQHRPEVERVTVQELPPDGAFEPPVETIANIASCHAPAEYVSEDCDGLKGRDQEDGDDSGGAIHRSRSRKRGSRSAFSEEVEQDSEEDSETSERDPDQGHEKNDFDHTRRNRMKSGTRGKHVRIDSSQDSQTSRAEVSEEPPAKKMRKSTAKHIQRMRNSNRRSVPSSSAEYSDDSESIRPVPRAKDSRNSRDQRQKSRPAVRRQKGAGFRPPRARASGLK